MIRRVSVSCGTHGIGSVDAALIAERIAWVVLNGHRVRAAAGSEFIRMWSPLANVEIQSGVVGLEDWSFGNRGIGITSHLVTAGVSYPHQPIASPISPRALRESSSAMSTEPPWILLANPRSGVTQPPEPEFAPPPPPRLIYFGGGTRAENRAR